MPVFNRWDMKTKTVGEPVALQHTDVEKVDELVLTTPKGRRHGSRVTKKDGTVIDLAVPAGEVQDRLNDAIASAPEMPTAVTEAVGGSTEPPADIAAYEGTDDPNGGDEANAQAMARDNPDDAHDPRTEDTDG